MPPASADFVKDRFTCSVSGIGSMWMLSLNCSSWPSPIHSP